MLVYWLLKNRTSLLVLEMDPKLDPQSYCSPPQEGGLKKIAPEPQALIYWTMDGINANPPSLWAEIFQDFQQTATDFSHPAWQSSSG